MDESAAAAAAAYAPLAAWTATKQAALCQGTTAGSLVRRHASFGSKRVISDPVRMHWHLFLKTVGVRVNRQVQRSATSVIGGEFPASVVRQGACLTPF